VSYERRNLAICACHWDTLVDTAGKVSNTILEVMVGDLHDIYDKKGWGFETNTRQDTLTRIMLDDCDFGALSKLASGVAETVLRNEN
jgi:hypothetical protein